MNKLITVIVLALIGGIGYFIINSINENDNNIDAYYEGTATLQEEFKAILASDITDVEKVELVITTACESVKCESIDIIDMNNEMVGIYKERQAPIHFSDGNRPVTERYEMIATQLSKFDLSGYLNKVKAMEIENKIQEALNNK